MLEYKTDYNYAYPVARIHSLETKLITKEQVQQLIDSPTEESITYFLKQINYGDLKDVEKIIDIQPYIDSELKNTFNLLYSLIPEYDQPLFNLLKSKYDFQNFKVIVSKSIFKQSDYTNSRNNLVELGNINPEVFVENMSLPEPFCSLSAEISAKVPASIEELEITTEKYFYEFLLTYSKRDMFMNNLFKTLIDLKNLLVLYQMKLFNLEKSKWFIDGGNITLKIFLELALKPVTQIIQFFKFTPYMFYQQIWEKSIENTASELQRTYSELEKLIDNYLIEYLYENSKFSFFSIAPIVNFLYLKEFEAQMLRTLWTAKLNRIDKNYIKANLRKIYA